VEGLYAAAHAGEVSAGGRPAGKLQGRLMRLNPMTLTALAFTLSGAMFSASVVAAPDSAQPDKPPSADCAKISK